MNATLLSADQRSSDTGADRQAIGANEDLALGIVDRANGEGRTVLLPRETNRYRRVRRYRGRGQYRPGGGRGHRLAPIRGKNSGRHYSNVNRQGVAHAETTGKSTLTVVP